MSQFSIKNQLHGHLEELSTKINAAREGYSSQNLSVPGKMALHIISEQKNKLSISKRLYKAAPDTGYIKNFSKFDSLALILDRQV